MGYLIGEKFLNLLEVAETDRPWREAMTAPGSKSFTKARC
jgi:hypothetical protein